MDQQVANEPEQAEGKRCAADKRRRTRFSASAAEEELRIVLERDDAPQSMRAGAKSTAVCMMKDAAG